MLFYIFLVRSYEIVFGKLFRKCVKNISYCSNRQFLFVSQSQRTGFNRRNGKIWIVCLFMSSLLLLNIFEYYKSSAKRCLSMHSLKTLFGCTILYCNFSLNDVEVCTLNGIILRYSVLYTYKKDFLICNSNSNRH